MGGFFKIIDFCFPHTSIVSYRKILNNKGQVPQFNIMFELDCYARQDEYIFTIKDPKGDQILTKVVLRPNESQQQLFSRFRKKVSKSGKLRAVRKKRWFVSKSELRRIARKKAIRKQKRRQSNRGRRGY